MGRSRDFNGRTFTCHDCERAAGSTKAFAPSMEAALLAPGTDFNTFLSYSDYKAHRAAVHGEGWQELAGILARSNCDCFEGGWA